MPEIGLTALYRAYIDCLNNRAWHDLGRYIAEDIAYNGNTIGLYGYRQAREAEFRNIPDLHFKIQMLIADDTTIASRLAFDITPRGEFLGLPVNGRRISFAENVFYECENDRIAKVWSIIDNVAVAAQLSGR
jgi:predicted ester cyclase